MAEPSDATASLDFSSTLRPFLKISQSYFFNDFQCTHDQ
jgi:hypothetical protein